MMLQHIDKQELIRWIRLDLARYFDLDEYRAFVFGSRVDGSAHDRSDIDIGIEGPTKVPLEVISRIKSDFENSPWLYKIDVVDFKSVSPQFYKIAKKKVEYI